MKSRTVTVTLTADLRQWNAGMRSMRRAAAEAQRNRTSRPVSTERLRVQRIGHAEMAAAKTWFAQHISPTTEKEQHHA